MPRLQHLIVASAFALPACLCGPSAAQAGDAAEPKTISTITGKERLGRKWSDEQRIDDCHVPEEYRTKERPNIRSDQTTASAKPEETEAAAKSQTDQ